MSISFSLLELILLQYVLFLYAKENPLATKGKREKGIENQIPIFAFIFDQLSLSVTVLLNTICSGVLSLLSRQ